MVREKTTGSIKKMITKDNFTLCAMKAYINISCKCIIEFEEDLAKFSNLVRLCAKNPGPIETHLCLNAVMILLNTFENRLCIQMMFFKVKKDDWYKLKTILIYLNRMPDEIYELKIINSEIPLCQEMLPVLRAI